MERGYRSITSRSDLTRLGFSDRQARVPALLLPVHGVTGDVVNYQIRPDQPRVVDGKTRKYENPRGTRMVLDVPPRCRAALRDPRIDLFITEGIRKADSAASLGLCCAALLGVWNFRHTNEHGGKTAIPEFELIALNGRTVRICFDSDVMSKDQVHLALVRIRGILRLWGARVLLVYLPPGTDGTKVGLDDFFAAGGTVDEILQLSTEELRATPDQRGTVSAGPYFERDGCIWWNKPGRDGEVPVHLSNFTARVRAELILDDGVETRRELEIEAHVAGRPVLCAVPARSFATLNWVTEHLGVEAIVAAGLGQHDHLRAAILSLSKGVERRTVFTHTGWRELPGVGWVYLHGGGAIGAAGSVAGIDVRLPESLDGMLLPDPPDGERLSQCLRASLDLTTLAPESISFALLSGVVRVAIGGGDASICLFGETDAFKTELATIFQSFFGTGFNARNLPGSWLSTANALEMLAFIAKDMLIVVDDFVPSGSRQDIQRMHRDAERILRAQGNRAGRDRLGPDALLRSGRPPRGMVLSTGEELPARHSALARSVILELAKGEVTGTRLTQAQCRCAEGCYAEAMAAFLQFMAGRKDDLVRAHAARAKHYRAIAQASERHRRTASAIADLQAAFEMLLHFALSTGVIARDEAQSWSRRCWTALLAVADSQARHHEAAEPASLFVRLLGSAIAAGEAHLAATDGGTPMSADSLGWRQDGTEGVGEDCRPHYRAYGIRVGWTDGDNLYLDQDASLKAAQAMASDAERLPVGPNTLARRLRSKGLLASVDEKRKRLLVRRTLSGSRAQVLHLKLCVLSGPAQPSQAAHDPTDGDDGGAFGDGPWAGSMRRPSETGPANRPADSDGAPDGPGSRSSGTVGPVLEQETRDGDRSRARHGHDRPGEVPPEGMSASQPGLPLDFGDSWEDL